MISSFIHKEKRMPTPIDPAQQLIEQWRPGVKTRMLASAVNGASQLCVFEQFCDPGAGAPTHFHAVEEVLTVLQGQAEAWVNEERTTLTAGQSLVIKPGKRHGFTNTGTTTLHMHAILAAPIFETYFDGTAEPSRRWTAGA
jgi:quercetin dioxygenase-like cupin family protein